MRPPSATGRDVAALIRRHLPIVPVPAVPELRLHLAAPHSRLGRLLAGRSSAGPPYWAHAWSGGLILARHLFDNPGVVSGRRVLDLGCGSGLVGIAAARAGARDVVAVDVDATAVAATQLNAALNGVTLRTRRADLLDEAVPETDVVLVGDLFYDATLAERVCAFLDRCVAVGCVPLVGDPGRSALPRSRLLQVSGGTTPDFGTGGPVASAVYRYKGA